MLTFLGFLLDTEQQIVCLPQEKIQKALDMIRHFVAKKKATVKEIERLTGFLIFLCRCVVPGLAFTRRLYALTQGIKLKPHHHVSLKAENRLDLKMWEHFLTSPNVFYAPFTDFSEYVNADEIELFSDASRNFRKGFGAWCQESWTYAVWDYKFMCDNDPSIEYLELFAVTVAVKLWIHRFGNRRIYLFCDNLSVVHMINNSSSRCKNCMVLIHIITLGGLLRNVRILAKHVRTEKNGIADSLSRLNFKKFRKLTRDRNFDEEMTQVPTELWPMKGIWLK